MEVAPDGTVSQSGQVLGRLELNNFSNTSVLAKQASSFHRCVRLCNSGKDTLAAGLATRSHLDAAQETNHEQADTHGD